MRLQRDPKKQNSPPDSVDQTLPQNQVQDVLGWLMFIRRYGGNLRKYGGPSGTRRAAQA